jgi:1-deoxy-D-xylulose-5-phosphate reductoisomerase
MKKKIAILGSTGSIGKSLFKILEKNKKNFYIELLTAKTDYKTLLKQASKFKVKNLIITNKQSYKILKEKTKNTNIKIYNNFESFNKIFRKKIDYVMSAIIGIDGLYPTYNIIKYTKKIAIANKESIICAWDLIFRKLKFCKTEFIPVDSEHFSIWYALKGTNRENLEKIILTASGGPFINLPLVKFKNIKIKDAIKHPNWKMGKKISIDSSTMMNKVFEIIEAKKIFNMRYDDLDILVHKKSYLHAIIKFKNGLSKLVIHDTNMSIPIFNTLYSDDDKEMKSRKIDINKLNNLNLIKVDKKKFPVVNILKKMPQKNSFIETILVSANDVLVELFLDKKISFNSISSELIKILDSKEFLSYKHSSPSNIEEILTLKKYVQLKIRSNFI